MYGLNISQYASVTKGARQAEAIKTLATRSIDDVLGYLNKGLDINAGEGRAGLRGVQLLGRFARNVKWTSHHLY